MKKKERKAKRKRVARKKKREEGMIWYLEMCGLGWFFSPQREKKNEGFAKWSKERRRKSGFEL